MINFNFQQLAERANSISFYTQYGFAYSHIIIDFITNDENINSENYDLIENIIEYIDFNFCKYVENITDIKAYISEYITRRKPTLDIQWQRHFQDKDSRVSSHNFEIYNKQDYRTLMTINITQISCISKKNVKKL